MAKRWRLLPHDMGRVEHLMRQSRLPAVVAQVLIRRGVFHSEDVQRFLESRLTMLRDPEDLPGVPAAADQIHQAILDRKSIVIYGDYDADGITGTAILFNGLKLLGADVSYFVPNRLEDGYGLNCDSIRKLATRGKQVVISVDCGIASPVEADLCKELGLELIVTDHHQFGDRLPDATLVHPRLPGTQYPFAGLCGAGVAFKLAWSVCQRACGAKKVTERLRSYLMQSLAVAAIGTVADVVPMLDENRILVHHGLRSLLSNPSIGMRELLKITKLDQKSALSSEDIAFMLAPRLNATGRLGQAQLGVELLTTDNPVRAAALAEYIDGLNGSRQALERSVYLAADKQAKSEFDPEQDPALVLSGVDWHKGVIGVVAGRIAEKYGRPTIILSLDGAAGKPAIGSARSGGMVDLHAMLGECDEHLITYGGHAAAAGVTLDESSLDRFREAFCEAVSQNVPSDYEAEISIDAEASFSLWNLETVKQVEMLEPFGDSNPRPIFCASGVSLKEPARKMGGGDRHLTVNLVQQNSAMRAVAFGAGQWCEELNELNAPIDVAYRPVINEFRGYRKVEIQIVDWRPSGQRASG